jgi:hypothetical protein
MQFSSSVIILFAALTAVNGSPLGRRAGVLKSSSYNDFQISSGTAGNAEANAKALFPIDTSDLANVDPADLEIIKNTHDIAEDAEVDGFNPAIDAASGDAADALQVCTHKLYLASAKTLAETICLELSSF